jgi:carboxypeptidase family protein
MSQLLRPHQVVSVLFILGLTIRGAAQVIPTSGTPPGPRTGMIVGQVVDATTGAPVPEAIVQLSMPMYSLNPAAPRGRVMADAEGRFFFTDLAAGEYYVGATKDGYASGSYGQRQAGESGLRLALTEGERRTDIKLRVWKYAVIAGTVVDEAGEPVVGVAVRALIKEIVAGRAQFGSASYLVPSGLTDDRGMFRLPRVQPGTYAVVAPSMQTTVPVSVMNTWDAATLRTELFWAGMYEVSPLGQPRTQQIGDFALMTLSGVLIPPPESATGRLSVYKTTYFPSAATAAEARPISVGAGEERADLTITLRPVPAVRVSGRLVTPDGSAPPPTSIRLVGQSMADVTTPSMPSGTAEVGFETATGVSDASGRFTLLGVPPGEYVLNQADMFLSRAAREGRTAYWVSQRIAVGGQDVDDLVVNVRRALRVEGRVELKDAVPGPQSSPRIGGIAFEAPSGDPGARFFVEVPQNGQFATAAAGGRYFARPSEIGGRFVVSVTLDGKDITDRAFDLQADATTFVVTFTDRPTKVSGTVRDARGAASPTAVALAFPVDPQQWLNYGASPRNLKSASMTQTGVYTFDHLPPGDYYLVAIELAESGGWKDPKALAALAGKATRLTIAAGDGPKAIDLSLKTIR